MRTSLLLPNAAPDSSGIAASIPDRPARLPRSASSPYSKDHRIKASAEDGAHRTLTIITKGLPLQRGRKKGSGLKQAEDEFNLYKQGYTPLEICRALGNSETES